MPYRYQAPLDPDCLDVIEFHQSHMDDPISQMSGCMGEITESFEAKHRALCLRCQEYGSANIEVVD